MMVEGGKEKADEGKVTTVPTGSYSVSYSWEPANIVTKEKYSILMMLKSAGRSLSSPVNYNVEIDVNNVQGSIVS